jgi:enolase-phosphatase E1
MAQKLLFEHSDCGDLSGLFTAHFDTAIGTKREADAYRAIAGALGFPPQEILFLSDVEAELAAAREAGLAVTLLARGGLPSAPSYPVVADFDTLLP